MPTSNTRVVCSVLSTGLYTRANNFPENTLFPTKSIKEICFFPHFSVLFWLDGLGSCKNEQHHCSELFISPLQCPSFCLLCRVSVLKWNGDKRITRWIKIQQWNRVTVALKSSGIQKKTQTKLRKECYLMANLLQHPWTAALVAQDPLALRGACRVPSAC